MTPAERRTADRLASEVQRQRAAARLGRDRREARARARADHERQLQAIRDAHRRIRRVEEGIILQGRQWRWRKPRPTGQGIPRDVALDRVRHVVETDPAVALLVDPDLPQLRAHVAAIGRQHAVAVDYAASWVQGYAFPSDRRIEVAPINSKADYGTALHEHGHVLRPCVPAHARVAVAGLIPHTVCVRCELNAWAWAMDAALMWTWAMHEDMGRSLNSYRPYATAAERLEIDRFTSKRAFDLERLRRMVGAVTHTRKGESKWH